MRRQILAVVTVLTVATAARGANLDQNRLLQDIPFNFGNPGAKSLGLGGAFIGRADDASAAEANPAGLTSITKREATLEIRSAETARNVNVGGTSPDFTFDNVADRSTAVPSFLSVVLPTQGAGVYSFYYHKLLSFELDSQNAAIDTGSGLALAAGRSRVDYKAETFGGAAAWSLGGLSLGGAVRYQRFQPGSSSIVTLSSGATRTLEIRDSDSAISYSAGLRWSTPTDNFSVGGVYKKGADYTVEEARTTGTSTTASPSAFNVPDVFGAGISFRPVTPLRINIDAVRVSYSSLLEGFNPALRNTCDTAGRNCAQNYDVPDVTEIHAGLQWTIVTNSAPIAIRAGAWRDPAHGLKFVEDSSLSSAGELAAAVYKGGEDVNHITAGFGYLGTAFEVNVGYDAADSGDTLAASMLFRF